MITKAAIDTAYTRIEKYIHYTPVISSAGINETAGCSVYFKCENFQKIGAFKARGAMNAVLSLSEEERSRGVATHSSGNHAQALARAAKLMGIPAYIVMPTNAPEIKKKGVNGFGGLITECEPTLQARESTLAGIVERTGAAVVHPFNDYAVITGQATVTKELLESYPELETIFAPVGGGGLLSGTCLAAKFYGSDTQVVGAEPEGADDAYRSMISGKIEPSQSQSIADGLLTTLGDRTFPIIQSMVKEIITVSDQEIVAAMRLIWDRLKIIVEPSGAVPLAALLKRKHQFRGKQVGIILSGGNVDLLRAFELFAKYA